LVTVRSVLDRTPDFAELLLGDRDEVFAELRQAEGSGRPLEHHSLSLVLSAYSADLFHGALQAVNPWPALPASS
jgi:hypothetical protein